MIMNTPKWTHAREVPEKVERLKKLAKKKRIQ